MPAVFHQHSCRKQQNSETTAAAVLPEISCTETRTELRLPFHAPHTVPAPAAPAAAEETPAAGQPILLEKKNIILNCKPVSPEEAIKAVGKRMVESGYVEESYIQGMLDREASFSVAIGSHVAIPHGTEESRKAIKKTGLIVMTYPEGIQWGDELVRLVVGIASTGEDHLGILGKIVEVAETEEDTDKLVDDATVDQLYKLLNGLE